MRTVREAGPSEVADVARVLEGALLTVPLDLETACADGRVLVIGDPVYGAAVVVPTGHGAHLVALAVTPRRRGEGVARTLLRSALERWRPLSATFDARVRPLYDALNFAIYPISSDRYRAVRR